VTNEEDRITGENRKMGSRKARHHPRQQQRSLVIGGGRS
jgi:hypothetical protein